MLSENVEMQISGKFSILLVVSDGLNKDGSEISVLWNIVYNFYTSFLFIFGIDFYRYTTNFKEAR